MESTGLTGRQTDGHSRGGANLPAAVETDSRARQRLADPRFDWFLLLATLLGAYGAGGLMFLALYW